MKYEEAKKMFKAVKKETVNDIYNALESGLHTSKAIAEATGLNVSTAVGFLSNPGRYEGTLGQVVREHYGRCAKIATTYKTEYKRYVNVDNPDDQLIVRVPHAYYYINK